MHSQNYKLAILFPGMGYHVDKPLLYYSKKLLSSQEYEILEINYGKLPQDKMGAFNTAMKATYQVINHINWEKYKDVIFISKSLGTCVSGKLCMELKKSYPYLPLRCIFFTPTNETLPLLHVKGIVFSGTNDPMVDQMDLTDACHKQEIPLFTYENANHSIETDDVATDIKNLSCIMNICKTFIET